MQPHSSITPGQQLLAYSLFHIQTIFASVLTASEPPQSEALTSNIEWNRTEISASVLLMAMAFLFLMCCAAIALLIIICCGFKTTDMNYSRSPQRLPGSGVLIENISTPEYRFETLHVSSSLEDDASKENLITEKPKHEPTPNVSPTSNHDAEMNIVRFHEDVSLKNPQGAQYNLMKEYTDVENRLCAENTVEKCSDRMEMSQETTRLNGNDNNLHNFQNQSQFQSILKSFIKFSQKTYEPLKNMELDLRFGRRAASKIPQHT